jgi:NAD(P)-dependent dehydrogenase (short-subunit alcohol dehydrogenase family)
MGTLTDKTALVTGGSRGIGRAVAQRLAADGALVAVHYGDNKAAAEEAVALINKMEGRAFTVQADFNSPDAVDQLIEGLTVALGSRGLDILVNNAGITSTNPIAAVTAEELDQIFRINVPWTPHGAQGWSPLRTQTS